VGDRVTETVTPAVLDAEMLSLTVTVAVRDDDGVKDGVRDGLEVADTEGDAETVALTKTGQADGMGTKRLAYDPLKPGHCWEVNPLPFSPLPSLMYTRQRSTKAVEKLLILSTTTYRRCPGGGSDTVARLRVPQEEPLSFCATNPVRSMFRSPRGHVVVINNTESTSLSDRHVSNVT
jgi:hypothetical protein